MEPDTQQSTQAAPKPVMDIVPPPKSIPPDIAPAADVKAPPSTASETTSSSEGKKSTSAKPAPKSARTPNMPRGGVSLAVAATVIVVLGLAALFVYAYLRTNDITVF